MAFTPTPLAGEVPDGTKWSNLLTEVRPLYARKTSDQTLSANATLTNDTELFVAVSANAEYDLELKAIQNSGATPAFKMDFTLPAGATWVTGLIVTGSSAANEQIATLATSAVSITGNAADSFILVKATLIIAGTSGNVQYRWAQLTSNASNTIVRAGSTLILRRLA